MISFPPGARVGRTFCISVGTADHPSHPQACSQRPADVNLTVSWCAGLHRRVRNVDVRSALPVGEHAEDQSSMWGGSAPGSTTSERSCAQQEIREGIAAWLTLQ